MAERSFFNIHQLWLIPTLVIALWLAVVAMPLNLAAACHWKQWPLLESCQNPDELPVEHQIQKLRARLTVNPGDSLAYAELARFATQPPTVLGASGTAVLDAASATAPFNATVLKLQAGRALQASDWGTAVSHLVVLSEKYSDAGARNALAALVAQSGTQPDLLKALLAAGESSQAWLLSSVRLMPAAKIPVAGATMLAGRLAQSQPLNPELGQLLIKQLKTEGAWVDAHAIWLSLWRKPLGFLFNGDFEQPFIPGTFDWEILDKATYRAGAQADLVSRNGKGRTLQVKLTARAIKLPIVAQDLLLPPGTYHFKGEFQSANLRSQEGLTWVFACASNNKELARTPGLLRTGLEWAPFSARVIVNDQCGPGVKLALQTQALYEAKTGQQGEMRFDNFSLTREDAR